MDFLHGKTLLQKGAVPVPAEVALKKKTLILYYFTVNESDTCREFDLKLYEVYQEALLRKVEMSVIVVSCDTDKESFTDNITKNYQEWYSVMFEDELLHILTYNYGVTHVPTLIVVRKNGTVVTRIGVKDVEDIGINVLVTWTE